MSSRVSKVEHSQMKRSTPRACADELVGPGGVARVEDRPAARLDPVPERQSAPARDGTGSAVTRASPRSDGLAGVQLAVLDRERQRFCGGLLVERREQRLHPALGAVRDRRSRAAAARRLVAVLHEQERHAAEVVAVEMA